MLDNSGTADPLPVISVVMAAFDAKATIDRPIQSLLAQTFRSWELIVVDDGSRDDTADRADAWALRDARIRLVRQANQGVASARNRGLAEARGDWIVFLDADDSIDRRHLALMLEAIKSSPGAGAAACGWARVGLDGKQTISVIRPPDWFSFESLYVHSEECIHSYLLPRQILQREGGFDVRYKTSEDWDLWIRLARLGLRFVVVPKVLAFYWDSRGSLTKDVRQLMMDCIAVRTLAQQPDPRISAPLPQYAGGIRRESPAADTLSTMLYLSAKLATGEATRELLDLLAPFRPLPPPVALADFIRLGLVVTVTGGQSALATNWSSIEPRAIAVLRAIEDWSQEPGVGDAVLDALEIDCLRRGAFRGTATLTHTLGLRPSAIFGRGEITASNPSIDRLAVKLKRGKRIEIASVPLFGALSRAELLGVLVRHMWHRIERKALKDTLFGKILRRLGCAVVQINRLLPVSSFRRLARPTPGEAVARIIAEERDRIAGWTPRLGPKADFAGRRTRQLEVDRLPPNGVVWDSTIRTRTEVEARLCRLRLPILTYHRIAEDGPVGLSPYRISAKAFEEQLVFLRQRAFRSWTPAQVTARARSHGWLPGRPIMITFDDGYMDFYETAWPILVRYGFTAHNFIVTERVGGVADWDAYLGQPAPLMDWREIAELAGQGATFGSHLATHRPATGLRSEDLLREAASSRLKLEKILGTPVTTVATPFGESSELVELVLEQAGYTHHFGSHSNRPAPICSNRLRIPRLLVTPDLDIDAFAKMVDASEEPADQADKPRELVAQ